MYHGVVKEPLPVDNWCQLDVALFEEQIGFLSQEYSVISLKEAVDRMAKDLPLPERCVALTFDDGFRTVYTTARPILERYEVPATIFLVTSLVGTGQPPWPERLFQAFLTSRLTSVFFNDEELQLSMPVQRSTAYKVFVAWLKTMEINEKDERLTGLLDMLGGETHVSPDSPLATMNWEEIEDLADTGLFAFGSHTHTHPILSRCAAERQRDELRISRDIVRDHLGSAELFAYPNGTPDDFTDVTKKLLQELGYRCGVSTVPGLNARSADVYELRRVPVGADTLLSQFEIGMLGL
jgi:peptidoglycan/xylan/chitin deacetylase (PgdA/CDA1 family)